MWIARVQDNYSSLEELESYDRNYGVVARCGFESANELWDANPLLKGSIYPEDFGIAEPSDMERQRWAFAPSEIPKDCNMQDELIATRLNECGGVIVYRNGAVSNRRADGVVGISEDEHIAADAEETLWHPDVSEGTGCWRDVIVNVTPGGDFGAFVSFAPDAVENPDFMLIADAIEIVLWLARPYAVTRATKLACDTLEDFAVNHLGDD